MPSKLKNVGAIYQLTMVTLFHDVMHMQIEVYVYDMIAKSREGKDHLVNSMKWTFGETSIKILGFIASKIGI